ncbi:MAG: hypothetical protein COA47_03060 [Robiginitomaculum sp.]|nr:MAG: hypothetical protein COA47_03060 [Robiginitomaculum sp.]
MVSRKKILFVTYGGGHANIVDLIAEEILARGDLDFKILALTSALDQLTPSYPDGSVSGISEYSFLFNDCIEEVHSIGKTMLASNYNPKFSKEESIWYLGLSMYDLIQTHGRERAYADYKKFGRKCFKPVDTISKILKFEKPDVLFTTTSPRFEEASILAASLLGIPTVQLLDLFGDVSPRPSADHIVVMNKNVEEQLRSRGITKPKIKIFGQPAIEKTVRSIQSCDRDALRKSLKIQPQEKVLLFASQRLVACNENLEIISNIPYNLIYDKLFPIFREMHERYGIIFLLRTHPNEDLCEYSDYLKDFKFIKHVNGTLNLEESLSISDILLTKTSTVGVEAAAAGMTVLTYMHDYDIGYSVPNYKVAPYIFSNGFRELTTNLHAVIPSIGARIASPRHFIESDCVGKTVSLLTELAQNGI